MSALISIIDNVWRVGIHLNIRWSKLVFLFRETLLFYFIFGSTKFTIQKPLLFIFCEIKRIQILNHEFFFIPNCRKKKLDHYYSKCFTVNVAHKNENVPNLTIKHTMNFKMIPLFFSRSRSLSFVCTKDKLSKAVKIHAGFFIQSFYCK